MLWVFDREEESLRLETRDDNDRSDFVAIVTYHDGSERTERFLTLDDFWKWLGKFDRLLQEQQWAGRGGDRSALRLAEQASKVTDRSGVHEGEERHRQTHDFDRTRDAGRAGYPNGGFSFLLPWR
jgi:hypothetical protein